MGVSFGLAKLKLTDGTVVEPPLDGMTVFTGPNNSGKSVLLQECVTLTHNYPGTGIAQPMLWVSGIEIHQEGSGEEFASWLNERGLARWHPFSRTTFVPDRSEERRLEMDRVITQWSSSTLPQISHLLMREQWTDKRLEDQTTSAFWDDQSLPPSHPSQRMWESAELHEYFSDLFERAFGKPIAINRYVPRIRLQIGSTGMDDTPPPASRELREAYEALPFLAGQGDGMRAFANILLHVLMRPTPLVVIDEPEAFLHPPQARLLGRYLALHVPSPCQVIVATHSVDFLSGVLEGNAANPTNSPKPLALVRISRSEGKQGAHILPPESVAEILDTPLLRYSNIVSGIFHDGVVLCEAEGDCHFYSASFDIVRGGGPHQNLTFLHVNGKARLGDAAYKLRACGIPAAVVADFDLLNDSVKIKQILSRLGGRWQDIQGDWETLQAHASSSVIATSAIEIKKSISGIIGNPQGKAALSRQQVEEITACLKTANGWKVIKGSGLSALSGEPYNAALRLVDYFANLGVFIVPVGELECWVRPIPATNKGSWLTRVFDEGHYKTPTPDLRAFCTRIVSYLGPGESTTVAPAVED